MMPDYLQLFFQLTNPETWDVFSALLDSRESQALLDMKKSVQDLIDKYEEL
jgi:hypothetical protein